MGHSGSRSQLRSVKPLEWPQPFRIHSTLCWRGNSPVLGLLDKCSSRSAWGRGCADGQRLGDGQMGGCREGQRCRCLCVCRASPLPGWALSRGKISTPSRVPTPGPQYSDSTHLKKQSHYFLTKFDFLKTSSSELMFFFLINEANILLLFSVSITITSPIINLDFVFIL